MEVDYQTSTENLDQEYKNIIADVEKNSGSVGKTDFETISVIGKGSYGKVVLVKKKDN